MSVWTHGYTFSTLGYNPMLCYLLLLLELFQRTLTEIKFKGYTSGTRKVILAI